MCGGTRSPPMSIWRARGLSPRVRGNRVQRIDDIAVQRSIPACAGEPASVRQAIWAARVYPRVCGGTRRHSGRRQWRRGLSPRVRGNLHHPPVLATHWRSIPACAGEPGSSADGPSTSPVYPRVCGGTSSEHPPLTERKGLSPRVRGNPRASANATLARGSIPACAGEPAGGCRCGSSGRVYPRVCGGTGAAESPRRRPRRSIPA